MLAVARRKLIRANPLVFPSTRPGFNPSHPVDAPGANNGFLASVVASNGTVTSILNGKVATATGSAASARPILGPVTTYTGATDVSTLAYNGAATPAGAITMAALGYITSVTSGASSFISWSAASSVNGLSVLSATGNFATTINGTAVDSGIAASLSAPYFVVSSSNTLATNFVIVNLASGVLKTATGGSAATFNGGDGNLYFGNRSGIRVLNGGLAAAMCNVTANIIPMPVLVQWASDPWSFWYPR